MNVLKIALGAVLLAGTIATSSSTVVLNLSAGRLNDENGLTGAQGILIQLVNLGVNGDFDVISVNDGSASGLSRWVSGDDSVIDSVFTVGGLPGDFTTAAFDLRYSGFAEATNGVLSRSFELADSAIPAGAKLGIRWFPALRATDFATITLQAGTRYGQFTRQDDPSRTGAQFDGPIHNGLGWVFPASPGNYGLDSLATADRAGGDETASMGNASFTVVPEPAAIGMSLLGAAGLAMLRRRRA
jgi:hypothetical protein